MGRGLGKLQREILDSLDRSKDASVVWCYSGGENADPARGWPERIRCGGAQIQVTPDVYDLRAVKLAVARADRERRISHASFVNEAFSVSFHRAVHSLVARGYLEGLDIWADDDGWGPPLTRQLRFVRRI